MMTMMMMVMMASRDEPMDGRADSFTKILLSPGAVEMKTHEGVERANDMEAGTQEPLTELLPPPLLERIRFVRLVAGVVSLQMVVMMNVFICFNLIPALRALLLGAMSPLLWVSWTTSIVFVAVFLCIGERVKNIDVLGGVLNAGVTISYGFFLSAVSCEMSSLGVATATAASCVVVATIIAFAMQTRIDMTAVPLRSFAAFGVLLFLSTSLNAAFPDAFVLSAIDGGVGLAINAAVLVFDVHSLMGSELGKTTGTDPADWAFASVSTYILVQNIFLAMLRLTELYVESAAHK